MGSAALFVAMTAVSFLRLPDAGRHPDLWPLVPLALVLAPGMVALNAIEYRVIGRMLGLATPAREAVQVSLVASVANYLPAPGGVAVRVAAATRAGSTVRAALWANVATGVVWVGVTAAAAGAALLVTGDLPASAALAVGAAGVAGIAAAAVLFGRRRPDDRAWVGWLLAVEAATVLLAAGRVFLSLRALGQPVSFGAALCISASIVLAAVVGIAPGGLGLREVLAGGIATAVAVPASAAVAASALDRLTFQVGVILAAAVLGLRPRDLRRAGPGQPVGSLGASGPVQDAGPATSR